MSPNDNSDPEDFVFIDNPVKSLPHRVGRNGSSTFNHAVDTDYVTVKNDNLVISTEQDGTSAPLPEPCIRIEYFEPMLLNSFPEDISQDVLMAAAPTEYEILLLKSTGPPPDLQKPHSRFVSNAILLFECFFHFQGLHPEFGRDSVLYAVGKACELRSEHPNNLQHQVRRTLDTLRESRVAFLRVTKDQYVWRAKDDNVRELARLVDRYIEHEGPREFGERWHMNPAVGDLWSKWQNVLRIKRLRLNKDQAGKSKAFYLKITLVNTITGPAQNYRSTGSERREVSDAVLAAARLVDALFRLDACGGSGGLTEAEKHVLTQALMTATRWTQNIQGSR